MIETIPDMPAGTLGFRSSGPLTAEDYRETLIPPLRAAVDRGDKIRVLFVVGDDFGETAGGLWEDVKSGVSLGIHRSAWERMALVTDVEWIRRAAKAAGWLAPGELRVFAPAQVEAARAWVAGA